jgi:hypothetical protein
MLSEVHVLYMLSLLFCVPHWSSWSFTVIKICYYTATDSTDMKPHEIKKHNE